MFQWTWKSGILYYTDQLQHWNFGLIAVFVKVAVQNYKKSTVLHFTSIHVFSEIARVFLGLANCKVYKGHLTKGYKRSTWWEL